MKKMLMIICILILIVTIIYFRSENKSVNLIEQLEFDLSSITSISHTNSVPREGEPLSVVQLPTSDVENVLSMLKNIEGERIKNVYYVDLYEQNTFDEHELIRIYIGNSKLRYIIDMYDFTEEEDRYIIFYKEEKMYFEISVDNDFCTYFTDRVKELN